MAGRAIKPSSSVRGKGKNPVAIAPGSDRGLSPTDPLTPKLNRYKMTLSPLRKTPRPAKGQKTSLSRSIASKEKGYIRRSLMKDHSIEVVPRIAASTRQPGSVKRSSSINLDRESQYRKFDPDFLRFRFRMKPTFGFLPNEKCVAE